MSAGDLELVRRFMPPPDMDLAPLFRNDGQWNAISGALASLVRADFECVIHLPPHEPRVYTGLDGVREAWLDWLGPWASYRNEFEDLIDTGERVLMLGRVKARLDAASPEVEHRGGALWTIREGRLARIEFYADRAQAMRAAGLEP